MVLRFSSCLFVSLVFFMAASHSRAEEPSVDALIDRLASDDPAVREQASHDLVARGADAEKRLTERLKGADAETAGRIREALQGIEIDRLRKTEFVKERDIRLHGGTIQCAAWSRDGKQFASAGETGEILVWDAATKKPVARIETPDDKVHALAFSADGKRLWVASAGPTVWDIQKQEVLHKFENEYACAVALSPDGIQAVLGGVVSPLLLVDEKSFEILKRIAFPPGIESVNFLAFRPDGHQLALCGYGSRVSTVDLEKGEFLPAEEAVERRIEGIAWRADGTRVVCDAKGNVWLGDQKKSLGERIHSVSVSPDGRRFAAESWGDGIVVYDENFKELGTWADAGDLRSVTSWRFDGSGLVCSAEHGLRLWLGERFELLGGHSALPRAIEFSPDGHWLCATSDGECLFVNTDSGEMKPGPEEAHVYNGSGGSTFVLALEKSIELWDASEGKLVRVLSKRRGNAGDVCALSPDGKRLLGGDSRGMTLDSMDGGSLTTIKGLEDLYLSGASWSPDSSRFLVYGSRLKNKPSSKLMVVFDASGKEIHRRESGERGGCFATWSADGKSLWWSSGDAVVQLDAATWSEAATLSIHASWWQPIDDRLAFARDKGVCGLWHLGTGICLKEFPETVGLYREALTREGRRVALAGHKGVTVWRIGK